MKIFTPVVEQLNLQIRFNLKIRNVEIRVSDRDRELAWLQAWQTVVDPKYGSIDAVSYI